MIDAKSLLGNLLQQGLSGRSAQGRMQHALGQRMPGGQGSILEQLASRFGIGGAAGQSGAMGDALGGLGGIARDAMGRAGDRLHRNDPMAVGGLGALAGALFGGRSGAIGGGLLAVLGSLAYSALQNSDGDQQAGRPSATPTTSSQQPGTSRPMSAQAPSWAGDDSADPAADSRAQQAAMLIIRAMISAAKADGKIDQQEAQRITGKLGESGTDEEARRFVMDEMRKPLDLDELIRTVPNQEVAAQIYAASLLAIDVDTANEQAYMQELARRLGLSAQVVGNINRSLGLT